MFDLSLEWWENHLGSMTNWLTYKNDELNTPSQSHEVYKPQFEWHLKPYLYIIKKSQQDRDLIMTVSATKKRRGFRICNEAIFFKSVCWDSAEHENDIMLTAWSVMSTEQPSNPLMHSL